MGIEQAKEIINMVSKYHKTISQFKERLPTA